jgi:hypothetical protein
VDVPPSGHVTPWPEQLTFVWERVLRVAYSPVADEVIFSSDVGANDPRVPVGEAEQIVAALRARHVPVAYLRYEDEGHGLSKLANRLDAYAKMVEFLDRHL